jgi:5-hydroxyisourate hydrolase-like protein (transthyretin family)
LTQPEGEIYENPVISGVITDESGKLLVGAEVCLEKEDKVIARVLTDESGRYEISVHTGPGTYDISATWEKLGKWQLGIEVKEGDYISVDLALKLAVSIKQKVLTPNHSIPHTYLHIKALRLDSDNSTILSISSTKTSGWGEYEFVNLKPGNYEIRCYTTDGYVYQYKRGELWYYQYGKRIPILLRAGSSIC